MVIYPERRRIKTMSVIMQEKDLKEQIAYMKRIIEPVHISLYKQKEV